MLKKGTSASPATALASKVLPVPGGPTSNTPEGARAPSLLNFSGLLSSSCNNLMLVIITNNNNNDNDNNTNDFDSNHTLSSS